LRYTTNKVCGSSLQGSFMPNKLIGYSGCQNQPATLPAHGMATDPVCSETATSFHEDLRLDRPLIAAGSRSRKSGLITRQTAGIVERLGRVCAFRSSLDAPAVLASKLRIGIPVCRAA